MTTPALLTVEYLPIGDLKPDPFNPRRISDEELETLTRSIQQFGLVDPIIVRRADLTVIGGHQRLVAARRLGYDAVPVVLVDLSQEQARLLNVALNKIAGTWDQELLARLLKDLSVVPELDLSLSGFSEDELQKLLKSLEAWDKRDKIEDFNLEDALATAEAAPTTRPGDLWLLGDHRLLCGDATNAEDVARLFDGETAALLATDPPYLVDYRGSNQLAAKSRKSKPERDQHWDDYVDPEASVSFYQTFLQLGLAHCVPNPPVYQWHAHRRQALVEQAWVAAGLLLHQQLIWVKARSVLTHSHFLWQHEPCFYGWITGKPPRKKPPADQSTVWQVDQQGQSMHIHPTQKPVELFLRPILYHTEPGRHRRGSSFPRTVRR